MQIRSLVINIILLIMMRMMVESYLNLEYLVLTPYCHLPGNLRNKKFKVASSAGFMKQVEIFGM